MKALALFFCLILNASCAELRFAKKYENIHPEFEVYVDQFIHDSKGKIDREDLGNLTIGFRNYGEDEGFVVGTCHPIANEIDINRVWWEFNWSGYKRMELIYHELGHCVLHRHHTEPTSSDEFMAYLEKFMFKVGIWEELPLMYDNCPASIMHPRVLSEDCFMKHYRYYLHELFSEVKYKNYVRARFSIYKVGVCKEPNIINHTKEWNRLDEQTLQRTKKTCRKRYKGCLKTFIKKNEYTYNAICS